MLSSVRTFCVLQVSSRHLPVLSLCCVASFVLSSADVLVAPIVVPFVLFCVWLLLLLLLYSVACMDCQDYCGSSCLVLFCHMYAFSRLSLICPGVCCFFLSDFHRLFFAYHALCYYCSCGLHFISFSLLLPVLRVRWPMPSTALSLLLQSPVIWPSCLMC